MTVRFESNRRKRSLPVRTRHAALIARHPAAFRLRSLLDWCEDGPRWRSPQVAYPDAVVAHCRHQTHYFDDAGLPRRLDYTVDIRGGGPAAQYVSEYREFDGIRVPTRRRVYLRNPDGWPVRESDSIAIDVTGVTFTRPWKGLLT